MVQKKGRVVVSSVKVYARTMKFKPITSIIVESTSKCNLSCIICPAHNGLMTRKKQNMDLDMFTKIMKENPNKERIVLHNWGEPLLNTDIFEMISISKTYNPEAIIFISTNGTLLNSKNIEKLLNSDITDIQISVEGVNSVYERIRGFNYKKLVSNINELISANYSLAGAMRKNIIISMVLNEDTRHQYEEFLNLWKTKATKVRFQNMVNYNTAKNRTTPCSWLLTKTCGQLVILSDGTIVPCCVDYNGQLGLGNCRDISLEEAWAGHKLESLRKNHLNGIFEGICLTCSEYESHYVENRF